MEAQLKLGIKLKGSFINYCFTLVKYERGGGDMLVSHLYFFEGLRKESL